ncbi:hypothetical protein [Bradyrhizobium zhanjiangense]|nr:hypothetical protein [Bradyrhizobium zhanjiangense]
MTKLTILSAATILSMMAATPVFAQAAFQAQEPAAVASYWRPNANIPNVSVHSSARGMGALAYLSPGRSHAKRHVAR